MRSNATFLASFFQLSGIFYRYSGVKLLALILLIFVGGVLEVMGFSLLLPILSHGSEAPPDNPLSDLVFATLQSLGVDPTLPNLLALLVAVFMFKGLLVFTQNAATLWITNQLRRDIQVDMSRRIADLSYESYTRQNAAFLASIVGREVDRLTSTFAKYARMIANIVYVVLYASGAIMISAGLSIAFVVIGGLAFATLRPFVNRTKRDSMEVSDQYANIQATLIQMVQNYVYLKATALIRPMLSHAEADITRLVGLERRIGLMKAGVQTMIEPILVLAIACLVYYQVVFLGHTVAATMILALLFYRALGQMLAFQGQWQDLHETIGGVYTVEKARHDLTMNNAGVVKGTQPPDLSQSIRFKNVDFSHGDRPILHDINLVIPANQTIGIVGESGAGKTTLFYLLTGLIQPVRGDILLGNLEYRDLDIDALRRCTGYVTQDPVLFDDTVANNISVWQCDGRRTECRQQIEKAASAAHCAEFIIAMNEGYESRVGERGLKLSGGQRQRIAIARELFKDPQLLIFDEATSALDSISEREVQKSIEEMRSERTVVIITHRLSTVRRCHLVYVLSEGRIAESGSFDELYHRPGSKFRSLCNKQDIQI